MRYADLTRSAEWKDFEIWCSQHHHNPLSVLRCMLRYRVYAREDIVEEFFKKDADGRWVCPNCHREPKR